MEAFFVPPVNHYPLAGDFLRQHCPDIPPGHLKQLLKRGKFLRGDIPLMAHQRLAPGEIIALPGNALFRQRLSEGSPPILYESEQSLVVSKPAALAVHTGVGHRDDNLLLRLSATMRQRKVRYRLHPVHRLDKETTGALILAKGKRSASRLGTLMMAGHISKTYLAIARDNLPREGTLDTPVPSHGKQRSALSSFRVLARAEGRCLLELTLHSGRTHQIRRQLADAGAPLVGDSRYAPGESSPATFSLHCRSICFPGGESDELISVSAPLPTTFLSNMAHFEFDSAATIVELEAFRKFGGALSKRALKE